jgi:XrtN system VIT domain protein
MVTQTKPADGVFLTGIILIAVSLLLYCIPAIMRVDEAAHFGMFALNYAIAIIYYFVLVGKKRLNKDMGGLPLIFVLLVLALISAWSLNRSMCVFEQSAPWLTVALVICSSGYLLVQYFETMPVWGRHILSFILGFALVLFLYLSIYLVKLYPISIILSLGLGFSLHAFVPLLFVLFTIKQAYRMIKASKTYLPAMVTGVVVPLLVAIIFTVSWTKLNNTAKDEFQNSLIADNTDLPAWVRIAQNMPDGKLTEKYLKSDLVYALPSQTWEWSMPSRDYEEARKHDPLIMFASIFSKPPSINQDERVKILESVYDARHKTLNRLWAGDNLVTQSVISNVRIWPESRIAYTEKTITVFCDDQRSRRRQEEGIYTFYLPEGGVVTSLSLWINRKEEKARLTTKSKADSAYKTIVGVENRDPSLVHWQEGNTVSVRVFPILSGGNRVFKIGVTAPLKFSDNRLTYENLYFRGPDVTGADEIIQVDWATIPPQMKMPGGFTANGKNRFIKKAGYDPSWQLAFQDPGIKSGSFSFDGHTYTVAPYTQQYAKRTFDKIYLDINKSWSQAELEEVLRVTRGREVYVHKESMVQLGDGMAPMVKELSTRNFSILPFHEIEDDTNSLIITKGTSNSPNIADLAESEFAAKLEKALGNGARYNVYCLDGALSPYLKTLKEHRVFNYGQGDVTSLKKMLADQVFPVNMENDSIIVVNSAAVTLTKTAGAATSSAPDHLMRLFSYNHIMQQLGARIFTNQETNDTLVGEARQAYIVTPISSMVVLETKKDYERFGIEESMNSLQNATLRSNGAVPEPEEWALIIIACGVILWTVRRRRLKKAVA